MMNEVMKNQTIYFDRFDHTLVVHFEDCTRVHRGKDDFHQRDLILHHQLSMTEEEPIENNIILLLKYFLLKLHTINRFSLLLKP